MKLRRLVYLAAWLVVFGIFIVIRMPASAPAAAFSDPCRLANVQGTLWQGNGELACRDPALGPASPWIDTLHLAWRWQAAELLAGQLAWDVTTSTGGSGKIALSPAGWSATAHSLLLPANAVAQVLPGPLPHSGWFGGIALDSPGWQCGWKDYRCAGMIRLDLTNVSSDLIPAGSLGEYRCESRPNAANDGDGLVLQLLTERGPLWLAGTAGVLHGAAKIDAEAWVEGNDPGKLDGLLRNFGPPDPATGHYRIVSQSN